MGTYILSVDQSTQGTKALLFDEQMQLVARAYKKHTQIVNKQGWVSHDLLEILGNTIAVCREVVETAGVEKQAIAAMGISNQRETTAAWNRETGEPLCHAIVWQCSRAKEICNRISREDAAQVERKTGIPLSPYFPAAKMAWIMQNIPEVAELSGDTLALGTIDSWLIYSLCDGHPHRCDYSNAGRTQLFDIHELQWEKGLCRLFKVPEQALPEICASDSCFGFTDLGGFLEKKIPVHGVLGDSHGALLGHNGIRAGCLKATYGTGSSIMMNTGNNAVASHHGLTTSLAWKLGDQVSYVLEGNLNYTGAVLSWLKNDVGIILDEADTENLAQEANPDDGTYFVPAFSGLGAPYWDNEATGMLTGITRTTGKKEIVKACLESIGYQITDLVRLMEQESGIAVSEIRVDGGPTVNAYLMQFQSDMSEKRILVPEIQEFSGLGAALAAGCGIGLYQYEQINNQQKYRDYQPVMMKERRDQLYLGWQDAIKRVLL